MWHGFQPFLTFGGGFAFPYLVDNACWRSSSHSCDVETTGTFLALRFTGTTSAEAPRSTFRERSLSVSRVVLNLWKIKTPMGWLAVDNDPLRSIFRERVGDCREIHHARGEPGAFETNAGFRV